MNPWIEHPSDLFSAVGTEALAGGFRAAIEAGRTADAQVVVAEVTPTRTDFHARWG